MDVSGAAADDEASAGPPRALGRYRVIAELGRGSTSIVYLGAVDGPSGYSKLSALKLLRPALAADPDMVALFLMEARIGAHLNHPNVASTLEIEESDAQPFIVMEFLDGKPLQDVVMTARIAFTPLPLHVHLAALSSALEGLGHAHAAVGPDGGPLGIVHRDVSPHNVFVTVSGTAKVLDFGFAQTAHSPNTMLTSAARVAYMSPEQSTGALVDARSDLFSIGVMMWEAVTRRRFWSDEATKADILRALRSGELPANREGALARCSSELRATILTATSPDPDDRYASASEFQEELRLALSQVTPATFALRDLGKRVETLFADDRARLQRAIEEHALQATTSRRSTPPTPRSRPPEAPATPTRALSAAPPAPPPLSKSPLPPPAKSPLPPPPRSPLPPPPTPGSAWPTSGTAYAPRSPAPRSPAPPPVMPSPTPAAAFPVERSTLSSAHPLPAIEATSGWRALPQLVAAGVLGVVIVVALAIAISHSTPGAPAPATGAAIVAAPATTAPAAIETARPILDTARPAIDPSQRAAPPEATVAAGTAGPTTPSPMAHPQSAAARPVLHKPPSPLSSAERVGAPDSSSGDQVSLPVMGARPQPARPARPIDSSNPYGQ